MKPALAVAIVLALAAPTRADDGADAFAALAATAQRITHLDGVVWALTTSCDKGDDTAKRQCRRVRDARAAELAGKLLVIDGDADAFSVGKYDRGKKAVAVALRACIRCAGIAVDGRTWLVTGSGAPPRGDGPVIAALYDNARGFADEAGARAWAAAVARVKVELVVRIPAHPVWQADGKQGVMLDIVGYRVFQPCDGAIVISSPRSGPAPADKATCSKHAEPPPPEEHVPDELSTDAIREAMKPGVSVSHICFDHFHVAGTARLKLTVNGNGDVVEVHQTGDFAGTPTGECLEKAVSSLKFPRTAQTQQTVNYPIVLR